MKTKLMNSIRALGLSLLCATGFYCTGTVAVAQTVTVNDGLEIAVYTVEEISGTTKLDEGDYLKLRVDSEVRVNGVVVLPKDAMVKAKVADLEGRGGAFNKLKIYVSAEYAQTPGGKLRLRATAEKGSDGRINATVPLSGKFSGKSLGKFFTKGEIGSIKAGTVLHFYVDEDQNIRL